MRVRQIGKNDISVKVNDLIRPRTSLPGIKPIWRVIRIKTVFDVAHIIMRNERALEFKILASDVVRHQYERVA